MAFQVGSQIRPELGNADFSGFARAAEIQASTLAQLGATIGDAIQKHQEKKQQKLFNDNFDNFLSTASQQDTELGKSLRGIGVKGKETAGVARKALGDDLIPLLKVLMSDSGETVKPVSPRTLEAAGEQAEELGFVYNEKTGNMEREVPIGKPSVMGNVGNFFSPGQPFTPTTTVTMPSEISEGITGMSELIRNKQVMQAQESMALENKNPLGLDIPTL